MTTSPTNTPPAPADDFVRRHVGPDDDELRHMLDTLGATASMLSSTKRCRSRSVTTP